MDLDVARVATVAILVAGCGPLSSVEPPRGLAYSANPADYAVGSPIPPNLPTSTGGPVASYAISPPLPAGLVLDGATGVISGTPTEPAASASYGVTATNPGGSATVTLALVVRGVGIAGLCDPPAPQVTGGAAACAYPAICTTPYVGPVVLDALTARLDLRFPIQLASTLRAPADATLQALDVVYAGAAALAPRTFAVSIPVPAGGASVVPVPLVSAQDFPAIAASAIGGFTRLTLGVRARGVTASLAPFTTRTFVVDVDACAGCLAVNLCPVGTTMASCPPAAFGQSSPGQTATYVCVSPFSASPASP